MRSQRLCDNNHAGSLSIQPVHKPGSRALLTRYKIVVRERICERSSFYLVRWMNQNAGGLVDENDVLVLIDYVERKWLGRRRRNRQRRGMDRDLVALRKPLTGQPLLAVYQHNAVSNHP